MSAAETQFIRRLKRDFEILHNGYPDFALIDKSTGKVIFVELKDGNDSIKPIQKRMHEVLRSAGCDVYVVAAVPLFEFLSNGKPPLEALQLASAIAADSNGRDQRTTMIGIGSDTKRELARLLKVERSNPMSPFRGAKLQTFVTQAVLEKMEKLETLNDNRGSDNDARTE